MYPEKAYFVRADAQYVKHLSHFDAFAQTIGRLAAQGQIMSLSMERKSPAEMLFHFLGAVYSIRHRFSANEDNGNGLSAIELYVVSDLPPHHFTLRRSLKMDHLGNVEVPPNGYRFHPREDGERIFFELLVGQGGP